MSERLVYVVTDGSYSDYGIVAVFDNEEAAEALRATLGGSDGRVEVYSLNNTTPTACDYWEAYVSSDPNDTRWENSPYKRQTKDWVTTREQNRPSAWYWSAGQRLKPIGCYHGYAVHLEADVAVKIARDAMYQYMAEHPEVDG